jgi:hypothetical protein
VPITTKQTGDACEMLVAAEITLAGIPAMKVPDLWPHYDVIAQPEHGSPQRISVKARTYATGSNFVDYRVGGEFDWLAAVIIMRSNFDDHVRRDIYVIPREVFEKRGKRSGPTTKRDEFYWRIDQMQERFPEFLSNFRLTRAGISQVPRVE